MNDEIIAVRPDDTEVLAVIIRNSAERLVLTMGKPAYAAINAPNVAIMVDRPATPKGPRGEPCNSRGRRT